MNALMKATTMYNGDEGVSTHKTERMDILIITLIVILGYAYMLYQLYIDKTPNDESRRNAQMQRTIPCYFPYKN